MSSFLNAIDILKKGGLAVLPTDTIYGIHTPALNKKSVEEVYKIRKRAPNKPFIILISSINDLNRFGIEVNQKVKNFLNSNWPNPLSVILSCPDKKFKYLHRGTKTLAFRMPKKEKLRKLIAETGPLISTSVNEEGKRPATTVKKAQEYFGQQIDVYVDKGPLQGKPSTLVKIENGEIEILRQGMYKPR